MKESDGMRSARRQGKTQTMNVSWDTGALKLAWRTSGHQQVCSGRGMTETPGLWQLGPLAA